MAAAAVDSAPTFNWMGVGKSHGPHIHYDSFHFAGQHYSLGDCVYLLPEEEGAPCYIARLVRAYEDTDAKEAERLVIEVQWFERRGSLPASVAASMHEAEVVESDLVDTNLVGCLDSKAVIITANSYEEACQHVPQDHSGEWHFCRGIWDSEKQRFQSYIDMAYQGGDVSAMMYQHYQQATLNGCGDTSDTMDDDTADLTPRAGGGKGRNAGGSRSRRASASGGGRGAAAANGAAAGGGSVVGGIGTKAGGIPGKVCCECGATQTPQWREGPKGPKTLCNACGVRYQRQQSKAKSNKRPAADRGGKDRDSSPAPRGGGGGGNRGSKQARVSKADASAANTPDAAAVAAAAAAEEAFAAAAMENHQMQQLQMAQLLASSAPEAAADPAAAAAGAGAAGAQHRHGTRRNAKNAAAAAVAAVAGGSPAGPCSKQGQGPTNKAAAAVDAAASGGKGKGKGARASAAAAEAAAAAAAANGGSVAATSAVAAAVAAAAAGPKGPHSKAAGAHPALAAAVAAAGEQLGYFADEGSPPNSNTRILEYEEGEDGGAANQQRQQQQQQQNLARSNTHEAADALQNMANGSEQQQQAGTQQHSNQHVRPEQLQQQQQQHQAPNSAQQQLLQQLAQQAVHPAVSAAAAAGMGFYGMGSPATALLIAEQGLPSDSMPLLSLDDKYRPGTPSGLGVADGLDGMNTNSLSPLKAHTQQLLAGSAANAAAAAAAAATAAAAAAGGAVGSALSMLPRYGGMSGSGAVCASPGRLISAMVQNLKLPAPLNLNPGMSPLGAATTLGMPSQQQQHQQHQSQQHHHGMLSDLLAGAGAADASRQQQQQQNGDASAAAAALQEQQQQQLSMDVDASAAGCGSDGADNRLLYQQLHGLLFRASSYTQDVQGLQGLFPGPSSPRALQQLTDQLEGLPEQDKAQVQQATKVVEEGLSKAKAAEAAVLAVHEVLQAKQAAADEARGEVERAVVQLQTVISTISPSVAAAAAAAPGSAVATPTAAADAAAAGAAAAAAAAATAGFMGQQGFALSNGAGGMLGLAEGVVGGNHHAYGPAAAAAASIAQGPMNMSYSDDLLRDPAEDDVQAVGVAAGAAAGGGGQAQQQQQQVYLKQEPGAAGVAGAAQGRAVGAAADVKPDPDAPSAAAGGSGAAVPPSAAAAQSTQLAPAAESAPVAA